MILQVVAETPPCLGQSCGRHMSTYSTWGWLLEHGKTVGILWIASVWDQNKQKHIIHNSTKQKQQKNNGTKSTKKKYQPSGFGVVHVGVFFTPHPGKTIQSDDHIFQTGLKPPRSYLSLWGFWATTSWWTSSTTFVTLQRPTQRPWRAMKVTSVWGWGENWKFPKMGWLKKTCSYRYL